MKTIVMRLMLASPILLGSLEAADAHCIVGNRFFPATLTVDDPCVADELSLPTISDFKNGDEPSAEELHIGGEYSKTITPNFGVHLRRNGFVSIFRMEVPLQASIISAPASSIKSQKRRRPNSPCRYHSTSIGEAPGRKRWMLDRSQRSRRRSLPARDSAFFPSL
jgi:hypothetical protein